MPRAPEARPQCHDARRTAAVRHPPTPAPAPDDGTDDRAVAAFHLDQRGEHGCGTDLSSVTREHPRNKGVHHPLGELGSEAPGTEFGDGLFGGRVGPRDRDFAKHPQAPQRSKITRRDKGERVCRNSAESAAGSEIPSPRLRLSSTRSPSSPNSRDQARVSGEIPSTELHEAQGPAQQILSEAC